MFEEGLIKSMWTGLFPGVDGALESSSGGVLRPGDGDDDWRGVRRRVGIGGYDSVVFRICSVRRRGSLEVER
jgi:hypothetical protein